MLFTVVRKPRKPLFELSQGYLNVITIAIALRSERLLGFIFLRKGALAQFQLLLDKMDLSLRLTFINI